MNPARHGDGQRVRTISPTSFEVHRGDVVRSTLMTGVDDEDFLADSNPGKSGLPKRTDTLQLPGQRLDLALSIALGKYYL